MLDANVLIGFLVQDDPKQSAAATALFQRTERREVTLHLEGLVVAEVVYVLLGRYGRERSEVVNVLLAIIRNAGVETLVEDVVASALRRFAPFNVDFSDAWLAARAARLGRAAASFDRDFDKFKDMRRHWRRAERPGNWKTNCCIWKTERNQNSLRLRKSATLMGDPFARPLIEYVVVWD